MAKLVGITGGIGSGKSVVGKVLSTMGYPIFYSDHEAKKLMQENQFIKNDLIDLFGADTYIDNELNRSFLANQIFKNPSLKSKVNAIVHPRVRQHFKTWAKKQKSKLAFNEAAILFETGGYKEFDATLLVVADKKIRIARVKARDKISTEQVEERMKNQWSDEQKKLLTNHIVYNNDNDLIVPQILKILEQLT